MGLLLLFNTPSASPTPAVTTIGLVSRCYCTNDEVLADLGMVGVDDENKLLSYILHASNFIERRIGNFIPKIETLALDGDGTAHLFIPPMLAITSVTDNGNSVASSQYLLYPSGRHWPNGPYSRLTVSPSGTKGSWTGRAQAVSIAGKSGLYEETVDTGATVASQSGSATSIVASNGAVISPGAVLLVESEQELVVGVGAATDSTTDLAEALDDSEEEIDVVSGAALHAGEVIRVDYEEMRIRQIVSNTLICQRGWNGTKRASHISGADVYVKRTFTVSRGVSGTTAASHTNKPITRYVPPFDVNLLCREMAALALKSAQTGYTGRAGNPDQGESFYLKMFPGDIKEIARNYRIVRL